MAEFPESLFSQDDDFMDIGTDDVELSDTFNPVKLEHNTCDDRFAVTSQMEHWDQDVLLSNAGLPEMNPLLELEDQIEDDFQKMLSDWESQIGSLQSQADEDEDDLTLCSSSSVADGPDMVGSEDSTSPVEEDEEEEENSIFSPEPSLVDDIPQQQKQQPILSTTTTYSSSSNGLSFGNSSNVKEEEEAEQPRLTIGKKTLAGIVISSGPGGHFETYEVIESCEGDSLPDLQSDCSVVNEDEIGGCNEDPQRKSQIIAAVHNHFSGSNRCFPPGRVPKIVPSQRIKDSLPKEIIEKIKASSQKSKTIAIIEPVHKNSSGQQQQQQQQQQPIVFPKCQQQQQQGGITSRFHEAGASLNRNKLRNIGIKQPPPPQSPSPQQAQVNLDHDYCSSSKSRRNRQNQHHHHPTSRTTDTTITVSAAVPVRTSLPPPQTSFVTAGNKTVIRVPSTPLSLNKRISRPSQVISLEKPSKLTTLETPSSLIVQMVKSMSVPNSSNMDELSPSLSTTSTSSQMVTQRRDSDLKKDSGLESGDVSDASNNDEDYALSPGGVSRQCTTAAAEDHLYDRLPSYVTAGLAGSEMVIKEEKEDAVIPSLETTVKCDSSASARILRSLRSCDSSLDSNSSDSSSFNTVKKQVVAPPALQLRRAAARRSAAARRRRTPSASRSSSSSPERYRSRSPAGRRRSSRKRSYDRERFTIDRQRREQEQRHVQQEKLRRVEERRVVYVGQIAEGTTRADLRKRFEVFGPIDEISVHFRDRGDNYGFVGFRFKVDAYEAVEHGNDDPSLPRVDICFGGRRTFCKEKYSDLDSMVESGKDSLSKGVDFDYLLRHARAGLKK